MSEGEELKGLSIEKGSRLDLIMTTFGVIWVNPLSKSYKIMIYDEDRKKSIQ